jgi:hypothetical protein
MLRIQRLLSLFHDVNRRPAVVASNHAVLFVMHGMQMVPCTARWDKWRNAATASRTI